MIGMATTTQKPFFHVILSDRDEWAVEAEWPDSTLERIGTFKDHPSAVNWVATQSEAWLCVRQIEKISTELRQTANPLQPRRPHTDSVA